MPAKLPQLLKAQLARPLPGPMVGSRFEPSPRLGRRYDAAPPDARQAAVLVLLYRHRDRWHVPLLLRPGNMVDHAGQIGLPGGAIEPGESSQEAALREYVEELGAACDDVEVLGPLSAIYVTGSNFRIQPWLAAVDHRPQFEPNPAEVELLLEVPLEHLCCEANFGSHRRRYRDASYTAPHFQWQQHRIWGATCMILGELVTILEECAADDAAVDCP